MPDSTPFIFDAHLDLSMNALEWNRDLSRPLDEIRGREAGQTDKKDRGRGTVSLPEMRRGNIGLCVATQIARYTKPGNPLPGWYSPEQAWAPLVYVSLFEMSITFSLWLTAMQLTSSAARISNLIYVTPFFSLLILHLVVGEKIYPATFVGLLLIVGSILFQARQDRKEHRATGRDQISRSRR